MFRKIVSFFRLSRWVNLLMIALTMLMVKIFLIDPCYSIIGLYDYSPRIGFVLMVISTVFVAAGGNIINDYFDRAADAVNKPDRTLVGNVFTETETKMFYIVTTAIGLVCSIAASVIVSRWALCLIVIAEIGLLYFYSARYKSVPMFGNFIVSLSGAMVVVIVWLYDILFYMNDFVTFARIEPIMDYMCLFVFAYAGFAFVASMVREIVKDLQDCDGDRKCGCGTMPVRWGEGVAKGVAVAFTIILLGMVAWWQYVMNVMQAKAVVYALFTVDVLCVAMVMQIINARESKQYAVASAMAKIIMLVGISTMALFYYC